MTKWRTVQFILLAAIFVQQPAEADDVNWIGDPGVPGDWAQEDNWDFGVPIAGDAADNAFINNGGIAQVTTDVGQIGEAGVNKGLSIGAFGNEGTVEILAGGSLTMNDFALLNVGSGADAMGTLTVNGGDFTAGISNDFVGSESVGIVEVIAGTFTHGPGGVFYGNGPTGMGFLDVSGTGTYTGGGIVLGFEGSTSHITLVGDTAVIDSLRNIQSHIGGEAIFSLKPGPSGINPIAVVKGGSENRGKLLLDGDNDTLNVDLTDYAFGSDSLTLFTYENLREGEFEDVNITGGDATLVYDVVGDGAFEIQLQFEEIDLKAALESITDPTERIAYVHDVLNTWMGDSNCDGEFNSTDFVTVFTANEYEDDIVGNSTWATGDWNGDREFTSSDFVTAFADGGYEQGPRAAARVVPEPDVTSVFSLVIVCLGFLSRRTKHVRYLGR